MYPMSLASGLTKLYLMPDSLQIQNTVTNTQNTKYKTQTQNRNTQAVYPMSPAPGLTKLYLIATAAPCCENPASAVCEHCECRPGAVIFGQIELHICCPSLLV